MRDIKKILTTLAVAVLIAGCSKQEEAPPPASPKTEQPKSAAPATTAKPAAVAPTGTVPPPAVTTSGTPAQEAAALETAYVSNPDFSARVETIYKLTDSGTPEAIASLGRLFHMEKDNDLKTEILDALFDIDGQDEKKAALLAAGAGADQPKDVRESAIDGLEDIDAKHALPILQALATDPDEEIRDLAKDAIESLQTAEAQQK
jgi:hypothetical protein